MNQIGLNTAEFKAAQEGKKVQWRWRKLSNGQPAKWTLSESTTSWDFKVFDFRPLPEPKVIYVNEYDCYKNIAHITAESAAVSADASVLRVAVKYVEAIE